MKPALSINGLANARDLGGLERVDGTTTPDHIFIRAERLDEVDASGWEALLAYGVRTVIDLRRPDESSGEVPSPLAHVRVDLDGDDVGFWAPYEADGRWERRSTTWHICKSCLTASLRCSPRCVGRRRRHPLPLLGRVGQNGARSRGAPSARSTSPATQLFATT